MDDPLVVPTASNGVPGLRRDLTLFFVLAYGLSWTVYIPLALAAQGWIAPLPAWLHLLAAYGPMLSALIVTGATRGRPGLHELLKRVTRWRIGWLWWGVAVASPILAFLLAIAIERVVTGRATALAQFGLVAEVPHVRGILGWVIWVFTFGLGEEIGWRGFALPRLQARRDARSASLTLGLLWAAWHGPVFFYNYELSLFGVLAFLIGILSGAVVLTWLYNSTGGSVLATIVWHGTYNAVVAGASGTISAMVTAGVIAGAVIIGNRYGPEAFSSRGKHALE